MGKAEICAPRRTQLLSCMAAAILGLATAAHGETVSKDAPKGYIVTSFAFASYEGGTADCPDGLNKSAKDIYLESLAPAERERLSKPEVEKELWKLLYAPGGNLGPGKRTHNRCADPKDFTSPPLRLIQGKIADGMDLQGNAPGGTCAHQRFASVDGKGEVDNQLWRAMGCIRGWRKGADIEKYAFDNIRAGEYEILLEIDGMADPRNNAHVTVGIYSSPDQAAVDAAANVLPDASLSVSGDPAYRAVAQGRMVDGVISTDPIDIRLKYRSAGYVDTDFYIKGARLRLEPQPDGSLKGKIGGWYDVETLYDGFIRQPQVVTSVLLAYSCPAVYGALTQLADGYPDPKTGQCSAISTAFRIEAIPAFVIHPKETKTKTAAAETK